MLKNHGLNILKDLEFPDHYNYSKNDLKKIFDKAKNLNCEIITTEKDFFRLKDENKDQIRYVKSELKIIDEEKLIKSIL